jgi:anti-sigma B factor antagonist
MLDEQPATMAESPDTFALALWGELDIARDDELRAHVAAFRRSLARDVVIDLTQVDFMDSTGLTALILLQHIAGDRGGQVRLTGAGLAARRVLEVSGVASLMTIVPE